MKRMHVQIINDNVFLANHLSCLSLVETIHSKKVSKGITVRVLAKANSKVKYANGNKSELPFHRSPDGAAVIPLDGGGYVYVSNSEVSKSKGGVYGLYFDHDGKVMDYKALLSGTSMNCGGGEYTTLLS